MKICYIASLFEPELGGGAAKVVFDLAHKMAEIGNNVSVITTSTKNNQKMYLDGRIKIYQIYAPNLYWIYDKDNQLNYKKIFFQLIDIWNPFVKKKVKLIIQNESPDIVHVHKLRGLSPSVWNAAKDSGIRKIIHTCHDYELISPQGALVGRIGKLSLQKSFPINIYQEIRSKNSNHVSDALAPSKFILQKHLDFRFFSKAKINVIPNSHGYTHNQIREFKFIKFFRSQELRLLFIGRLVQEKGIEILCDVVSNLCLQGHKIFLDVIGSGEFETVLKEKKSYKDRIFFHGSHFGQRKIDYLKSCDVLVVPSNWPESFGIVITEPFAFGKPVIALNIGAIPEIVKEGYNGFIFEPDNKEQLQATILNIYQDMTILTEMRENCFQSAERYCVENFIDSHLQIYDEK